MSNVKSRADRRLVGRAHDIRGPRNRQTETDRHGARPGRAWLHDAHFIRWDHAGPEQAPVVRILDQLEIHHRPIRDDDRGEVSARAIVGAGPHDAIEARRRQNRLEFFTEERVGAEADGVRLAVGDVDQLVRTAMGNVVLVHDLDDDAAPRHRHEFRVAGGDFDRNRHHLIERARSDAQDVAARAPGRCACRSGRTRRASRPGYTSVSGSSAPLVMAGTNTAPDPAGTAVVSAASCSSARRRDPPVQLRFGGPDWASTVMDGCWVAPDGACCATAGVERASSVTATAVIRP